MKGLPPVTARPWIAVAAAVWIVSLVMSVPRSPAVGTYEGPVNLVSPTRLGRFGNWAIGEVGGGDVLVDLGSEEPRRGSVLWVTGQISEGEKGPVLDIEEVARTHESSNPLLDAGDWLRSRVLGALEPLEGGRALLAGFLIGDVEGVRSEDVEAMRLAGLSHFVAVSGSNVALVLSLVAVIGGPLVMGPRRRILVSLGVIPVYAAATGFEPSVMRASVMAAIVLGGRLVGLVLDPWQSLSLAVVVLMVLDPSLSRSIGFQLSVAATAGVLIGAKFGESKVGRALGIGLGAQVAVAPLLLAHFGAVPLLSPLANLVAAPLVAVATGLAAAGVLGFGFLIPPAAFVAEAVLGIARTASTWPQVGVVAVVGLSVGVVAVAISPKVRPLIVAVATVVACVAIADGDQLPPAAAAVLDVGQGDAILLNGGEGRYALVDGGSDPSTLVSALRRFGVRRLDLVVITHVHDDHIGGIEGLVGMYDVETVWADFRSHETPTSESLATRLGGDWQIPKPGDVYDLGALQLVVRGPVRRYASPNDQSVVVEVVGPGSTMLLTGDIEVDAQRDLRGLRAEVLKVPHHGAGTSDPDWLVDVGASLSVISVGPNDFGHPVEWVIATLERSGSAVRRTDLEGDIIVHLG